MPTTWLVRRTGSDNNGGTSASIRSTGTDGVTATGTNTLTSVSASWTAADIGHGVFIGGVNQWRLVTAVASGTSLTFSGATITTGTGRTWTIGGAFLTINKAVGGTAPLAAADSIYVGAGVYREAVSLGVSGSSGNIITLAGDVDGAQTGDPGEVQITGWGTNARTTPTTTALTTNSKTFWTIQFFYIAGGTSPVLIPSGSTNITVQDCAVGAYGNVNSIVITTLVDTNCAIVIDRCRLFKQAGVITVSSPTSATADYNIGLTVRNCVSFGGSGTFVDFTPSGAASFKPGGIAIVNCTHIGAAVLQARINSATTIPCTVTNCISMAAGNAWLNAQTAGQITENWNVFYGTAATNVTQGAQTQSGVIQPDLHFGQELIWGGQSRPFATPTRSSPLIGFGASASPTPPTVDLLNRSRPDGGSILASGTATSGAATTLTHTGSTWGTNAWAGFVVKIISGTGSGQIKSIASNTATVLTVDGNWTTNPDSTSIYRIYDGIFATTGKATSGGATTLTDSAAAWGTSQWVGYTLEITGGTGSGQTKTITSHTATALTVSTWTTNPDSTSTYSIYKQTGVNTALNSVGAVGRHENAQKETTTVDAGSSALRLTNISTHDLLIPVDAASTTITIRSRYDSEHATTNKPQITLLANAEIGVTTQTITGAAAVDTWETLTLSAFTPTAKGWVTVRLISRAANPDGIAYFDTLTVT